MNHKKSIIKFLGAVFTVCAVMTSCYDFAEVPLVKLAALENEITMEAGGGTFEIKFYSNSSYHIEYLGEADWLTIKTSEAVDEMATLTGECAPNNGFKRRVDFVLCSDLAARKDTIVVKQMAFNDAYIDFGGASITLPGAGGSTESTIQTNIPFEDMSVDIVYSDVNNKDWITDFYIIDGESEDREMHIEVEPNGDVVAPRTASIVLSFTDGWGDRVAVRINLLQCNANEEAATDISFENFRSQYSGGGIVYDYIQLSGIVVSNKDNGNAGCPVQTDNTTIDYTNIGTTIYLESDDGKYGVAIYADSEEDNIFDQFDRVTILLHGMTVTRNGSGVDCPSRYEMTGFEQSMVFKRESGTSAPEKKRTIGSLTDDDMFTYVTLTDVQLPVRKGPLFPVFGTYYEATNIQKCTKYPLLVIDNEGNDLYMLTNSMCTYHRDGTRLPYGSGNISGVVTHEHFSRFSWASGLGGYYDDSTVETAGEKIGNIGKYQLRHQTKEDVWGDMGDDFETGDFKLLTEYRYRFVKSIKDDDNLKDMGDSLDFPTYGHNGWLTHTWQTKYTGTSSKNFTTGGRHLSYNASFDYVGVCGNTGNYMYGNNRGNKSGLGIIIDPDHEPYLETSRQGRFALDREGKMEYACEYSKDKNCGYGEGGWTTAYETSTSSTYGNVPNAEGTGRCVSDALLNFTSNYWWDYDYDEASGHPIGTSHGYLINVSTAGISSDVVCMQFAIRAVGERGYSPRYWTAEWTTTDPVPTASVVWNPIGDFTVGDASYVSLTTVWSIQAPKMINFKLDNSILGNENVYIFIHPTSDLCGSREDDYDNSHLSDYTSENSITLSYFAIRYI